MRRFSAPTAPASQTTSPASSDIDPGPHEHESDQIGQNIAAVREFHVRQARELGRAQRVAESIANAVGRPAFLGAILALVALWVAVNAVRTAFGLAALDPAPYFWLQGFVSLGALLITTVVLIKQNRMARLAEQRAHLDLRLTLLIEQKAAKMIDLLEELRRDAPNIPDRHDPQAAVLQQAMDPGKVLAALDESVPLAPGPSPEPDAPAGEPGKQAGEAVAYPGGR